MEIERRRKSHDRRFGFGRRMTADRRVSVVPTDVEQRSSADRRSLRERRTTFDRRSTTRRFSVQGPQGPDSLPQ
jgi:hypothetical protein